MNSLKIWLICLMFVSVALEGCVMTQTFGTVARQGDTVTVGLGYQTSLSRQNATVTITDAAGTKTTYAPNDTHVRAIVNLYPDPVSRAVVGGMTNQDLGYNATATKYLINTYVTLGDNDWYQTMMVLDLPAAMAAGAATISVSNGVSSFSPITVNVLPGTGISNLFSIYNIVGNPMDLLAPTAYPQLLATMERADRYTVTFTNTSSIAITAIQVALVHSPGVGIAWVANPRGDLKNVVWHDDGSNLNVMLTPTQGTLLGAKNSKFYVAGGITGLSVISVSAYDSSGQSIVGVTASVQ
jgi:hypothetical protein